MITQVLWASMVDFPGHTCAVLFVDKCNFNCAYCYNKSLKDKIALDFDKQILPKLKERKDFVNHVIISGGEPTQDIQFEYILDKLNKEGFIVGIHTNGYNLEIIKRNINKISFFGIDIKTSWDKYCMSAGITNENVVDNVKETIKLIVENKKEYEFRTTLFPEHVTLADAVSIAAFLKEMGVASYNLQQFYAVNGAKECMPYTYSELLNIQSACNEIIPTKLKSK